MDLGGKQKDKGQWQRSIICRPSLPQRLPVKRHAASDNSPEKQSLDDDLEILMSMWDSMGDDEEQVKQALAERGLEFTGNP